MYVCDPLKLTELTRAGVGAPETAKLISRGVPHVLKLEPSAIAPVLVPFTVTASVGPVPIVTSKRKANNRLLRFFIRRLLLGH